MTRARVQPLPRIGEIVRVWLPVRPDGVAPDGPRPAIIVDVDADDPLRVHLNVFTRPHDELDPWLENVSYSASTPDPARATWFRPPDIAEIADRVRESQETFGFEEALARLKLGGKVRRRNWFPKDHLVMDRGHIVAPTVNNGNTRIADFAEDEILATDWMNA